MKKMLVIDDEDVIRELLGEVLQMLGYEAVLCGSPKEALELFSTRHQEFDMVFMDMMMPEMTGKQLYQEFSKIDKNKKVIILSGYSMEQENRELLEAGVAAFVQKPISIKELSRIIKEIL